jgi:nucleoside 2-deoxyribosyltransferase
MPFGAQRCERLYECIEKATREARLTCLRGDKVPGSGRELRTKIHELIVRAEVVIAEISEPNVNVYYEFGYAAGLKKTVWLLAEPGTKTPSDIGGLEYIP